MPTSHSQWGSSTSSEDSNSQQEPILDVLASAEDRWLSLNTPEQIAWGADAMWVEERGSGFQTPSHIAGGFSGFGRGSETPPWKYQFSPQDSRSMDISPYFRTGNGRGRRRGGPHNPFRPLGFEGRFLASAELTRLRMEAGFGPSTSFSATKDSDPKWNPFSFPRGQEEDSKSQQGVDVQGQGTQEAQSPRTVVEEAPHVDMSFQKPSSSHKRTDVENGDEVPKEQEEGTLEARLQSAMHTMGVQVPAMGTAENEAYWKEVIASASAMFSKSKSLGAQESEGHKRNEKETAKKIPTPPQVFRTTG